MNEILVVILMTIGFIIEGIDLAKMAEAEKYHEETLFAMLSIIALIGTLLFGLCMYIFQLSLQYMPFERTKDCPQAALA